MVIKFRQNGNVATKAKWRRMCSNRGWAPSVKYFRVGFSDWSLRKDDNGYYYIEASSTYHTKQTIEEMYKTNFRFWK